MREHTRQVTDGIAGTNEHRTKTIFLDGCASMQKRGELRRLRQMAKRWRAKKLSLSLRPQVRDFFANPFFDFMQMATTAVNPRRQTPELQHEISFVRLPTAHVTR
jgi:hypothetical protein